MKSNSRISSKPEADGRAALSSRLGRHEWYALLFGLFLGLGILKFGNPVVLAEQIASPRSWEEIRSFAWPPLWAVWGLIPLSLIGLGVAMGSRTRWSGSPWLWVLPLTWFGWQLVAATQTVDSYLTGLALWQFGGCLACYFLGAKLFGRPRWLGWLLVGTLAAFAFCLVRAANQKWVEFPEDRQALMEGERVGWTNFTPELAQQLRQEGTIVSSNGVEVANPMIIAKYTKGRVMGTLIYSNALAGAVLLLWPVSLALARDKTRGFRLPVRAAVIALTFLLGSLGLYWTGSKLGWLVAVAMAGVWLFRLDWPKLWKIAAFSAVIVAGLAVFAIRFHSYFAAGATSVGARFDYWRAAIQNTKDHPWVGSGPGTFQRPYARLKPPEAEMARLTHNDYLEQFSDSGMIGGIVYLAWIATALRTAGRRVWSRRDPFLVAIFFGLLGWFGQGVGEFGLYIPALAWTAFALLGGILSCAVQPEDVPVE